MLVFSLSSEVKQLFLPFLVAGLVIWKLFLKQLTLGRCSLYKTGKKARPFPAAFAHRGPFDVVASQERGSTSYFQQTFEAPLTEDDMGKAVRAHEYGHLKWDREHSALRKALAVLPEDVVQAGLDAVINEHLKSKKVSISALPWSVSKEVLERRETILLAVRERALGKKAYFKRCTWADKRALNKIYKCLQSGSEKVVFQGFNALFDLVLEDIEELEETEGKKKALKEGDVSEGADKGGKEARKLIDAPIPWGKMKIDKLEPPVAYSAVRAYNRTLVNGFIGGFSQPHRALLPAMDGKAWRRRIRSKGGSLLIDVSGSMSFEEEDIARCLEQNPALTCAMYSGDGATGTLYILSDKGKKREKIPEYKGGNVVDGPALRWLTEQESPRVWYCDGNVTGTGDRRHETLTQEAESLRRIGSIQRVENFEDAKAALEKK